ncbi:MAG: hypothetical protein KatS3mg132_816 [Limisphaera sp.]|nr:MAG: hypothetical protein KatS3mg132_816 [Limisphaera sp.]
MNRVRAIAVGWLFTGLIPVPAGSIALDELAVWSGTGTNRAGWIVVWPAPDRPAGCGDASSSGRARAWGFRWNGRATVADMVRSVLASDPRLFAVAAREMTNGWSVWGLGFDANGNQRFGLRNSQRVWPPEAFDAGLLALDEETATGAVSLEPGDWYAGRTGAKAWRLWREPGAAGGWDLAPEGRDWVRADVPWDQSDLADGAWVALTWDDDAGAVAPVAVRPADPPDSPYATSLVQIRGFLGPEPYGDAQATLGMPTRWFYDPWAALSGRATMRRASPWEAPFYRSSETGSNLLATFPEGSAVILAFNRPITNDPAHPYGVDFLVFGNAFFVTGVPMGDEVDPAATWISGEVFEEPLLVSVSPGYRGQPGEVENDPDTWAWYRYETGPFADTAYPTLAFVWDTGQGGWSDEPTDFTRPVHPRLMSWLRRGVWSMAEVLAWYGGSGGGTGFDLAASGFDSVRYIKIEGAGPDRAWGEVDAVSRARIPEFGETWLLLPADDGSGDDGLWFMDATDPEAGAVELRVHNLPGPAWVRVEQMGAAPAEVSGCPLTGVRLELRPAWSGVLTGNLAEARIVLPRSYEGQGTDLEVWIRSERGWIRHPFAWDPATHAVRVADAAAPVELWITRVARPVLRVTRVGEEIRLACDAVPGWRHVLERRTDDRAWSEVASSAPEQPGEVEWRQPLEPAGVVLYRLRLDRP